MCFAQTEDHAFTWARHVWGYTYLRFSKIHRWELFIFVKNWMCSFISSVSKWRKNKFILTYYCAGYHCFALGSVNKKQPRNGEMIIRRPYLIPYTWVIHFYAGSSSAKSVLSNHIAANVESLITAAVPRCSDGLLGFLLWQPGPFYSLKVSGMWPLSGFFKETNLNFSTECLFSTAKKEGKERET